MTRFFNIFACGLCLFSALLPGREPAPVMDAILFALAAANALTALMPRDE